MNLKEKIFKRKTGKSKGKWIVRIEYFDEVKGKPRFMERHTDTKGAATDLRNRLVAEIKKSHGQSQTGERMTFNDLTDICERQFYKPATIAQGRKVSGVRSIGAARSQIKTLKKFFGKRFLREITTESLTDYKLQRIKSVSRRTGENVKISSANRELSIMRKMMRFALGKGWILKDIFFNAKVIDASAEVERSRVLKFDEEKRLLEACEGERSTTYTRNHRGKIETITAKTSANNPHLKAMIVLAIDSGMRRGEILKLKWNDVDFENRLISVLGTHTKTERPRLAPLSDRAKNELEGLREISPDDEIFPFAEIKRSFATAKRIAGIDNLHFHDLRRTAITRWIQQGTPIALAGKLGGHTQLQTTMKHYTATDEASVKEITARMNKFNALLETSQIENDLIN